MSDTRSAKRKAEELEAVPEAEHDIKKRAKKDEEENAEGVAEVGGSDEEDDVDPDELEALDAANVIEGGRRTRGVRVDYTKLKVDENDEEEGEEEEDDDDEEDAQAANGEVNGEDQAGYDGEDSQNTKKETNEQEEDED